MPNDVIVPLFVLGESGRRYSAGTPVNWGKDAQATIGSELQASNVHNPGVGVPPPNTGQPLNVQGNARSPANPVDRQ